jgi:hypothetical protein
MMSNRFKVILFSGKKQEWSAWEERFLAKARRKGFKNLFLGRETTPKSSAVIDTSNNTGKAQKKMV